MKAWIGLALLSLSVGTGWWSLQDPAAPPKQVLRLKPEPPKAQEPTMSDWMAKKLEYSNAILKGLTSNDFALIKAQAEQMQLLGKVEEFVRRPAPGYSDQMRLFEIATAQLIVQSEHQNIEGATLAFNHLTASCVACHTSLREQGGAPRSAPPPVKK